MYLPVWTTPHLSCPIHLYPCLDPHIGPDSYWNDHTSTLHCLEQSLSRSTFHLKCSISTPHCLDRTLSRSIIHPTLTPSISGPLLHMNLSYLIPLLPDHSVS